MVQSVEQLTLGYGSGGEIEPQHRVLHSVQSLLKFLSAPSLSLHALSLSLSIK